MKKVILLLIISMNSALLLSCGNNTKVSNKDAQIEELQKELDSLKQQVGQNQQVQQTQAINQQVPIQNYQSNTINNQNANITIDQAKQIATSNAGLDVNAVAFTKTITDYDDGLLKWEIEFVANNVKYEYDIDANTGNILKTERKNVTNQGSYIPQNNNGMAQTIDLEQAKSIATSQAGFNVSNVTFTKTRYDFDNGMAKWEIEFVVNTNKYECEVSATNGSVLEFKVESIYND